MQGKNFSYACVVGSTTLKQDRRESRESFISLPRILTGPSLNGDQWHGSDRFDTIGNKESLGEKLGQKQRVLCKESIWVAKESFVVLPWVHYDLALLVFFSFSLLF